MNAVVRKCRNPYFWMQNISWFCFKIIKLEYIWNYHGITKTVPTSVVFFVSCDLWSTTCPLGRHRVHASWMYMAKLAAAKEFAYMKALKDRSGLGKNEWFRINCVSKRAIDLCLLACCGFTIYSTCFFFVYLFIFTYCFYSFICSFVNMWKKPTSPWRVAPWIVDSFQSENSKWEHRLMPDRSRMKDFLYRAPSIRIATSWSCPLLGCSETAFEF